MSQDKKIMHYPIEIKYQDEFLNLIWYSEENNDFLICDNEKLKTFNSLLDLKSFCSKNDLELNMIDEIKKYDFDQLKNWINNRNDLTDHDLLDFWNLFTDISVSLNCDYSGDKGDKLICKQYKKLCDSVIWNKKSNQDNNIIKISSDRILISQILNDGLRIFDKHK